MSPNTARGGTLNVLIDLGFDDAAELSAKVILAMKINHLIDARSPSHACAAMACGISPTKVAAIRDYRLQAVSVAQLKGALNVLRPSEHKA